MVVFFDSSSFFQSSGNAAAQFGEDLRDGIVTHACTIWDSFPRFVTNGRNPASSFARGYMNQVCSTVNPSPPNLSVPFTGGQCPTRYTIFVEFDVIPQGSTTPQTRREFCFQNIRGPLQSLTANVDNVRNEVGVTVVAPQTPNGSSVGFNTPSGSTVPEDSVVFDVIRQDGLPDDCGDPPPEYPPETPPQPGDLNTTINITNIDGFDTVYDLTWNQVNNNYNFPMYFKLNGVNVTLDLGGIHIYGDPQADSINSPKSTDSPGNDGGRDSDGNDYTIIYPDQDFPTLPDFVQPDLVEAVLDYILCESGVISELSQAVKLIPGTSVWVILLLEILGNIVEDICADDSDVGIPEIYPALPGVGRPIVMLYYKEVVNGVKGRSTYTTTVVHPSASTIANLSTLAPPDRVLGQYICSILLSDGSRAVARGDTPAEADAQFNYILGLIDSSFVPAVPANTKILTLNPRLQVKSVKCTQVEYYPNGKSPGVSPSEKYFLPV